MSSSIPKYANIYIKTSNRHIFQGSIKSLIRKSDYTEVQVSFEFYPRYAPCEKGSMARHIPYTTFIKFAPKEYIDSLPNAKYLTVSFYQ